MSAVAERNQDQPLAESNVVGMFERMACDPNVDVAKLEKLMELSERVNAQTAKQRFSAAMSTAQSEMRPVAADANNPQTRSKYATYSAIDNKLRPIYTKHGFSLSFDTGEGAPESCIRVMCYVEHADGHSRTYHLDMPADGKGAKGGDVMTKTHAAGAAMSYGMRYLLKMIFNVAVGEDDNDGNGVGNEPTAKQSSQAPTYSDASFTENFPKWKAAVKGGKKSPDGVIKMIESAYVLTPDQIKQIKAIGQEDAQ